MAGEHVRYVRTTAAHHRRVDEETVMFDAERGKYFALNAVGTRVWELVAEPASIDELCSRLREEFAVEADRCRTEIESLLQDLVGAGLVQEAR